MKIDEREISKRPKPKNVGHKGGRGGTNAPHKDKVQDEVLDGEGANLDHEGGDYVHERGENFREGDNLEQPNPEFSTNDFLPNWNLLPSGDLLQMSNEDVLCHHSPDQSVPYEAANKDPSPPLSYPTFNLLSQSPSRPQLVPDPIAQGQQLVLTQLQQPPSAQRQLPPSAQRHQPPTMQ